MSSRNTDRLFLASRARSSAEYAYDRLTLERLIRLPWDVTWITRATMQWTDSNLLGSEQMGFGGYSSVRGYDEREANGDEGYLVTTELRSPPISLGQLCGWEKAIDQFQFLGFWDYGVAQNLSLLPNEDPSVLLASAGPGIRYAINPYLSLRFDYGFQLYDTRANSRYNSRAHIGVVISY